jgi:hypothetical protein
LSAGAFRTGTVTALRRRAGGALRGVATGAAFRTAFRVFLSDLVTTRLVGRFGLTRLAATRRVVFADFVVFLAAFDFVAAFDAAFLVVFLAGLAPERLVERVAPRRAVFAAFRVALRDAVRLTGRELFRAAFLGPPAALRLAIACSLCWATYTPHCRPRCRPQL